MIKKYCFLLICCSCLLSYVRAQEINPFEIPCEELEKYAEFQESDTLPMTVDKVPETLSQCLAALDELLSPYQKRYIACIPRDQVRETLHYGFGTWIRNVWKLWDASPLRFHFLNRGVLHPDDMSSIIMVSYYRKLTGEPLNVEEQIDYFYNYWRAKGVNIDSLLLSAQKNEKLIEDQRKAAEGGRN